MLCRTPDERREYSLVWKLANTLGRTVKSALREESVGIEGKGEDDEKGRHVKEIGRGVRMGCVE